MEEVKLLSQVSPLKDPNVLAIFLRWEVGSNNIFL